MPSRIKPKRSYTANAVPTTSDLETNELAIRWDSSSPAIFTKNAAGNIVSVTLGGGGGGGGSGSVVSAATVAGFPATGSSGSVIYLATDTARVYIWQGAYIEVGASGGGSGTDAGLRDLFVPPAPTGLTATAGNGSATLSWTAPTVLAQTPITDYREQFSTDGGTTWTTFTAAASTATTATVTGLTNGQSVRFRVAAINALGVGAYTAASSAVTPVAGDALFANVALLLPGDSNINDASGYNRSVTAVGGAAASTAQKKWGAGSLYFDGSGDYLTIPSSTSLDFGGGNFVVEAWFRTSQGTADATLIVREWVSDPWENAWTVQFTSSSALRIYSTAHSSGAPLLVGSTPCRDGNWHHFAWVRTGSSHKLFLDGVLDASATSSASWTSAAKNITVGNDLTFGSGGRAYEGYIDDLRITVGSDRGYTGSSIAVPVQAFPVS